MCPYVCNASVFDLVSSSYNLVGHFLFALFSQLSLLIYKKTGISINQSYWTALSCTIDFERFPVIIWLRPTLLHLKEVGDMTIQTMEQSTFILCHEAFSYCGSYTFCDWMKLLVAMMQTMLEPACDITWFYKMCKCFDLSRFFNCWISQKKKLYCQVI